MGLIEYEDVGEEEMPDCHDPVTGKVRLLAAPCATCITRPPGERIKLSNARISQFIQGAVRSDSYIICHSTLSAEPAVCRGFYDRYSTNFLRVMTRLGGFTEVPAP